MGYRARRITVLPYLVGTLLSAQSPSFDAALSNASKLLGSGTALSIDAAGDLVLLRNDDYDVVRKDRIAVQDIDVEAIMLGTSGSILVPCRQERPRCAQSTIYRADQELRSSVLRIPAPADPIVAGTAVTFLRSTLIDIVDVADRLSETSTPSLRSSGTPMNATP